jgi:ferric-dicitrate binding protein FerR (iron transport regulator)
MRQEISRASGDVSDAAIVWLARLHADDVSVDEQLEFARWLACPGHRLAFDEILKLWRLLGCVRDVDDAVAEYCAPYGWRRSGGSLNARN